MSISVNPITLRRAYNRGENWWHESLTVLGENLHGFVVEDLFRATYYSGGQYQHHYQSLQYGLPKNLFFDVPSLQQIPQIADFRVPVPELDEVFGFIDEQVAITYLFGYQTEIAHPAEIAEQSCGFQVCDPIDATNILITASSTDRRLTEHTQKLMGDFCPTDVISRVIDSNTVEAYDITTFHLPYFFQNTPSLDGTSEDEAFAAETKRRLDELRQICQQRWEDHLKQLREKVAPPAQSTDAAKSPDPT